MRMLSTNQTSVGTGLGAVGLVVGAMVSLDSARLDQTDPDSDSFSSRLLL